MIRNIVIVTSYFAPAWAYGGPPKVLFTLAKELVKLGMNIHVITTDSLGDSRSPISEEDMSGIHIHRYRTISNTLSYKTKFFYVPQLLSKTKAILNKADFVLFSDIRSIFNWHLSTYTSEKKIPYGIFAFGEIPYGNGIKSVIKRIFDMLWVQDFVQKAKFRFAQTRHEQKMYSLIYHMKRENCHLFSLPIDDKTTKPNKKIIQNFKKKWKVEDDDIVLLFIGRIHYLKGIDIAICALETFIRNNRHIKFLIVGRDDGFLPQLQNQIPKDIENNIIFTGPLYNNEVKAVFQISSCFIITPRHFEETSIASLEALAHGVPVVVTYEAEIPFLEKYQAGYVVKNRQSDIIGSVGKIIYQSQKDKQHLGENAKRFIKENYGAKTSALHFLSIISNEFSYNKC